MSSEASKLKRILTIITLFLYLICPWPLGLSISEYTSKRGSINLMISKEIKKRLQLVCFYC